MERHLHLHTLSQSESCRIQHSDLSLYMSNTISALSVHALQHTEEHLSLPSSSRSPSSVVPQKNGSCPCKLASHVSQVLLWALLASG